MTALIEAVLAGLGVGLLIFLAIGVLVARAPAEPSPPYEDAATPYREGLHAAIRMQHIAHDLEQQIYAAAAGHLDEGPGRAP